jgi:hypothetical protein
MDLWILCGLGSRTRRIDDRIEKGVIQQLSQKNEFEIAVG